MLSRLVQSSLLLASSVSAAETVLGAYIFSRHGDRTSKSTPPTALTDLGYQQVYQSGSYYRSRYIASDASLKIAGISSDVVSNSQLSVSAPSDLVLQNSAQGFLQGLYPAVGSSLSTEKLRNGSTAQSPLNGYQLIPISIVSSGSGSESSGWLQSSTSCANAELSSNEYFYSPEYMTMLKKTQTFYTDLLPVINSTFNSSDTSFKNAYTIFDYINVAEIHNITFPASDLITNATYHQLQTLADTHEYNLAYNASSPVRAIAGMQLAAQIVDYLNSTIAEGMGKSLTDSRPDKLGIQFGAYGSFQSFFGLADIPAKNPEFYGIPGYAAAMVFELYTNASGSMFPTSTSDLNVRFFFHNTTINNNGAGAPVAYSLFGKDPSTALAGMPWDDFVSAMGKISVGTTEQWCTMCGNSTGICSGYDGSSPSGTGSGSSSSNGGGSGMSNAVAGVIGAMVTLGVILLVEIAILLLGGLRLVRKRRLVQGRNVANGGAGTMK